MTPLLRLAGLIAFAILIVVLLVFWISSCQGAGKKNSYKSYYEKVANVSKASDQIGRELNDALTTQGIKFSELDSKLTGLSQREQQNVAAMRGIHAPGPLRQRAPGGDRGARVPGQRAARPRRGLPPGVRVAEERDGQRAQAAAASRRPPGRERRDLGGSVPGARAGERRRAPARGDQRRRRPRLALRHEPGLRELPLLGGDPPAAPGRGHLRRRRLRRPARHGSRARRGEGAARQPGALHRHGEHGHRDHRPRLLGHGRGHRRLAGGPGQGDADDPADARRRSSRRRRST